MYHKWWWYVWFLRYQARHTEFFVLLGHFLPFYPTNNLENQTSEKMKQNTGDIIISHMSTINKNHMIYDFWDMECNRQNFFSFDHFLSFYPSPLALPFNNPKNQNFEKIKETPRDIYHNFTQVYHKWQSHDIWWFLRYQLQLQQTDFFCHPGPFFCLFTP